MRLIGLNGLKRSGKDTAYSFIEDSLAAANVVALREAFADRLKQAGMAALGVKDPASVPPSARPLTLTLTEYADEFKEHGQLEAGVYGDFEYFSTGREFLQNFGAAGRDYFGKDFWLDLVLPHTYAELEEKYLWVDVLVVTDVRYPNEADRISLLGGEVWNIHRPGLEPDGHSSEEPLPDFMIDRIIDNSGTLDQFEVNVLEAAKEALA